LCVLRRFVWTQSWVNGRCPDGGLLCDDVAAMLCTPAGHGWSLSARVAAEPCAWAGARRVARCDSFEIQTAWSVYTARAHSAVQGCASSARGCRFRLQRECTSDVRTFKLWLVLVAAEVMELWRRSGDELALGTHAPLAIERRPHVPVCPSVGGNLGELSAGDLPQPDFRGVRGCTSTSRALYGQMKGKDS
jgi:hypothetical protein